MTSTSPWTVSTIRAALESKKASARELASDFLSRIEKQNPHINAFLTVSPERALTQAAHVDQMVARREPLPPLVGVPVAIKDVISTRGIRTT